MSEVCYRCGDRGHSGFTGCPKYPIGTTPPNVISPSVGDSALLRITTALERIATELEASDG